jgi:hypothetical protein
LGLILGRLVAWATYVMWDGCEHFVLYASRNEIFWCGECTHILVIGQMVMSPSTSSLRCKFCHVPPFCVVDYSGQIYYVVHKL